MLRPIGNLTEDLSAELPECSQILAHMNPIDFHGIDFGLGRSAAAGYNGAGMPHPSAGRRRQAGNKTDNRNGQIAGDKIRSVFFSRPADFTHHHHTFGVGILLEGFKTINKTGTVDRIAPDTDAGGLPDTLQG